MNDLIVQAIKIMGIGMGSVFFVLLLFFCMIKILVKVFPYKSNSEKEGGMLK